MTLNKIVLLLFLAAFASLSACRSGPVERAGEKVDEAVKDAGRAVKDAVD